MQIGRLESAGSARVLVWVGARRRRWWAVLGLFACVAMPAHLLAQERASSGRLLRWLGPFENRVDLDGDGRYDSYWSIETARGACTLKLFASDDDRLRWSTSLADCRSLASPPVFYRRSFMGDASRDFSVVVRPPIGWGFRLQVGDGATGELRDLSVLLGNASRESIARVHGTAVVDFRIPKYPGPALFVRSTGGGSEQRGRLYHFPSGSRSFVDISEDPAVVDRSLFRGYPFPGVDIAGLLDGRDLYSEIYNRFNAGIGECASFLPTERSGGCGVPDGNEPKSPLWNRGNGNFLDKVAVGDIDQDGVDDLLLTYLWRSVVYPGRPRGQARFLGAPQYDHQYSPQQDGTGCHSGRHYGLSVLALVRGSRYLTTVDIAGTPVGQFADPYQNVSRNIAAVRVEELPGGVGFQRTLAWNIPLGSSIPGCGGASQFDNVIHYPADGLIRDIAGRARLIQVNRWTQTVRPSEQCVVNDTSCYARHLSAQRGYWTWELRDAALGTLLGLSRNTYVWDMLAVPGSEDVWVLLSSSADQWDLSGYRGDLAVARLDAATLKLGPRQPLTPLARPYLKTQHWQGLVEAVSSNWPATRLWTLPRPAAVASFVLDTPQGPTVITLDDASWNAARP